MHFTSAATVITGALAAALTLGATLQPAEAGRVCNRLDLSSPCISSSDLKARLNLDEAGRDGRLRVRDADGENAVELDAGSANLTNLFSNLEDESNGLVKAWAQINADGTIAACWRCNTDPAETNRLDTGIYEVDFTPLSTDVRGRPRTTSSDGFGNIIPPLTTTTVTDRADDASSILVGTLDPSTLTLTDASFVLIIY
jgi:hypothetical protein